MSQLSPFRNEISQFGDASLVATKVYLRSLETHAQ